MSTHRGFKTIRQSIVQHEATLARPEASTSRPRKPTTLRRGSKPAKIVAYLRGRKTPASSTEVGAHVSMSPSKAASALTLLAYRGLVEQCAKGWRAKEVTVEEAD